MTLLLLLLFLPGCSASSSPGSGLPGPSDSGAGHDGGPGVDGGATPADIGGLPVDATPGPADLGPAPVDGPPPDLAPPLPDQGPVPDATRDAGEPAGDQGPPATDSGAAGDLGPGPDQGGPADGGRALADTPPDQRGPYPVGERDFAWSDPSRGGFFGRSVATKVWYPAVTPPPGTPTANYMLLLQDTAYADLQPLREAGPFPLVLFSHGNKGVNFQSFSFTSFLASHGFVVAAPDHQGNTMFDNPNDEAMAQVALDRPLDMAFVLTKLQAENADPTSPFYRLLDLRKTAITGHSFGGYTALLLAGGEVDVSAAQARCQAGVAGNVFCPYIPYWPAGTTVRRPAGLESLAVAVAMAPGGYAAFGDAGLAAIHMPVMILGGTLDEYTRNDLRPIYGALGPPKAKVEITGMGHMGFTDICRIPINQLIPTLSDMCDPARFIPVDRGFAIVNPFVVAFLRKHLRGEAAMDAYLSPAYAATFPEAAFESEAGGGAE